MIIVDLSTQDWMRMIVIDLSTQELRLVDNNSCRFEYSGIALGR